MFLKQTCLFIIAILKRCEAEVTITSEWEITATGLLQELPSFGKCWMESDIQEVSGCLTGELSRNDRIKWAVHLSRCFLGLMRRDVPCARNPLFCDSQAILQSDSTLKKVFASFLNQSDSFCGYIVSLQRIRGSLEKIKIVAGEVREALFNASTLLLHESIYSGVGTSNQRKTFAESLSAQRAQLRASLETSAASLSEFVRHSSTTTLIRIVNIVRFIAEHSSSLELVLSLSLPLTMCWSLTVGELTKSARVPLMFLWSFAAIVNHMFRDSVSAELRSLALLSIVMISLFIYITRGYKSLRKYGAEIVRLERTVEKADTLLARARTLI